MKKWIEKQLDMERRTSRIMLTTAGLMAGVIALMFCYMALTPFIDGVYVLDTAEKVERFSQKSYMDGVLHYGAALDTGGEAGITTTRGSSLNLFMNGGYMESPLPDSTQEKIYRVWRLAGDGYTVLYLTEGAFDGSGTVHVQVLNRELSDEIIRDFAPGESDVYVLYDAGSPVPYLAMTGAFLLAAAVLLWLCRARVLRRRTGLGRQIAALGDFDRIAAELNRQAEDPLLDSSALTILKDWALLRAHPVGPVGASRAVLLPAANIAQITVARDEDDDQLYICSFHAKDREQPFTVYLDSAQVEKLDSLKRDFLGDHPRANA